MFIGNVGLRVDLAATTLSSRIYDWVERKHLFFYKYISNKETKKK